MIKSDVNTFQGISRFRFVILVVCFLLAVSAVFARAVYLQVINAPFLLRQGDARVVRTEAIPAHRGLIVDRNGIALAVSTPLKSIWVNPEALLEDKAVSGKTQQIRQIAKACNLVPEEFQKLLNKHRNKEFLYIKRGLAPQEADRIIAQVESGLYGATEYGRFYPAANVAAHVVGMTNIDEQGQEGLELAYNDWLAGKPGAKTVIRDLHGKRVKDLSLIKSASAGNNLELSIDMRLQHIAYRELELAVKKHRANSGSMVILDVESGEVLSMVNHPSFNPNNRAAMAAGNVRNLAVTDLFEPGSTIKAFTAAAALDSGKYDENSLIETKPIYMNRKRIQDIHYYGTLNIEGILTKSSNVGASKLGIAVGPEALNGFFGQIGLGQTTNSGFPGERSGGLPVHVKWKNIDVATLSYGYGLSVTALQLAHVYATLANGGVSHPVSLIKLKEKPAGDRVIKQETAEKVVAMLESVVSRKGTASRAQIEGYRIAGKTGTVHLLQRNESAKNSYADNAYMSLFAGIAPAHKPKVAVVIVVKNPQGQEYYGGAVAAPIFASVMKQALPLLDIRPDKPETKIEPPVLKVSDLSGATL